MCIVRDIIINNFLSEIIIFFRYVRHGGAGGVAVLWIVVRFFAAEIFTVIGGRCIFIEFCVIVVTVRRIKFDIVDGLVI